MSIFISYSHKDQPVVAQMAEIIRTSFGQENVFFDQWSMQPGDSIISAMNQGLTNCKFFVFFISKNSLSSEMVKLEWMNALMKQVRGDIKFIPVKIDDCLIPAILLQNLYINLYGYGMDFALGQLIDVLSGKNTYQRNELNGFQNIRAYVSGTSLEYKIEFRAEAYSEPHSKYLILLSNDEEEIECSAINNELFFKGFEKKMTLSDGRSANGFYISRSESTSPNFPFYVSLKSIGGKPIEIVTTMKAISNDGFVCIPLIQIF